MHVNNDDGTTVGTAAWVERTSGRLTAVERRGLLGPLARTHLRNTVGRLRLATGLHPGRNAYVRTARLTSPDTVLTRAARDRVERWLPTPPLLGAARGNDHRRHRAAPPVRLQVRLADAFRQEARRMPEGRARFLHRYGRSPAQ